MKFYTEFVLCLLASWTLVACVSNAPTADDVMAGGGDGGDTVMDGDGGFTGGAGAGGEQSQPSANGGQGVAGSGPDAGTGSDAAGGEAAVPAGMVPMFVAVGPGLRTTISCDDGLTWVENRFEKESDDDFSHDETNIHGAVFSNGRFYYPAGWGPSNTRIFASENGIDWERLYLGAAHQSNSMAAGDGVLVFGEGSTIRRSADDGKTWTEVRLPADYSHMRLTHGGYQGGRFVVGGRDKRHTYSTNGGRTWIKGQGDGGHRPVYGGGVFVSFQEEGGSLVRSNDGGATWQPVSCCGNPGYIAHVFWSGTRFLLFTDNSVWASVDGAVWEKQSSVVMARLNAMARNPSSGTFVAAAGGRPVRFFRSADGLRWQPLADRAFSPQGAEIKYITFGYGRPSAKCPLRSLP
ncbi:MAG: hypothetical protein SF187_04395 [Deltaproteobacteria bacterium]|nr:hypothetical protein [Deltaproteobacteria bacterium]